MLIWILFNEWIYEQLLSSANTQIMLKMTMYNCTCSTFMSLLNANSFQFSISCNKKNISNPRSTNQKVLKIYPKLRICIKYSF